MRLGQPKINSETLSQNKTKIFQCSATAKYISRLGSGPRASHFFLTRPSGLSKEALGPRLMRITVPLCSQSKEKGWCSTQQASGLILQSFLVQWDMEEGRGAERSNHSMSPGLGEPKILLCLLGLITPPYNSLHTHTSIYAFTYKISPAPEYSLTQKKTQTYTYINTFTCSHTTLGKVAILGDIINIYFCSSTSSFLVCSIRYGLRLPGFGGFFVAVGYVTKR